MCSQEVPLLVAPNCVIEGAAAAAGAGCGPLHCASNAWMSSCGRTATTRGGSAPPKPNRKNRDPRTESLSARVSSMPAHWATKSTFVRFARVASSGSMDASSQAAGQSQARWRARGRCAEKASCHATHHNSVSPNQHQEDCPPKAVVGRNWRVPQHNGGRHAIPNKSASSHS